jgi:glycosyltransferase involved in cell wall biosynthesis
MRPLIAILADYPPDHATFTGGVATATAALLEGLRAYQHEFEFHIISTSTVIHWDIVEQRDGFWFHFLSVPHTRWVRPRLVFRMAKTYALLRRLKPQLVHGQANVAASVAAPSRACKRVHTVHGILRDEARLRTGWEYWAAYAHLPLERLVFQQCDAFIYISDYAANMVGPESRGFRIPNAVSSLFLQTPRVDTMRAPRLLFTGVLAPLKRPSDLLEAHERLQTRFPDLVTSFCGPVEDAGYARAMKERVFTNQVPGVEFLGTVSRERMATLLAGASALILPSAQENTPMVIAEAMAIGIPVVATRVGGIPEMIRHSETGLLYRPGDVEALTSALELILSDPGLRQRLGNRARERARELYSPRRVGDATVAVYRQLLGLREPPKVQNYQAVH